ncbi:MAG: DUF4369 domain-containing protein [Phascolarctobacterium sp.]|nr:DUF4369 domain-containing protein [Phascolarctobacterium sp.]
MKKNIYLLLALLTLIASCSDKKNDFTLKGKISGLSSDTLLVYYQVPEYKLDTIFCKNGVFEYNLEPDTTTMFSLIFNVAESLPIFAEKGQTVLLTGSIQEPEIQGQGDNQLMNKILALLRNTPERKIEHVVDSLMQANKQSFTNIYLFEKYYSSAQEPNYKHMEKLVNSLSGNIKDSPYFMLLQPKLEDLSDNNKTQNIHSLIGKDRQGKDFKWGEIRDKYILLDFWASWNPQSIAEQDSLVSVIKALKKEKFQICSISLDLDKEAWLKASDRDTTQWKQICDFKGWNQPLVKSQNIQSLPSNLLLDKNKRIIARDIRGKELTDKVKELIQKDKEREKERQKKASKKKK